MDFGKIQLFKLMHAKMAYGAEKHDILAHNIANADTPDFEAQRLKEVDFRNMAIEGSRKLRLRATSEAHMKGGSAGTGEFKTEDMRKTYETTPVENNIALEEQIAAMAHNKQSYEMTVNMYRKTAEMFRTAIGNR